jgi:ribosomal protein S18 acetylase RimI-like enzyme
MSQTFSYRIRELRLGDIPAVVELGHRHFTAKTLPLLHQTWGETEALNNYTSDPEFCLVAEREGRPIGFILGTLMTPDPARRATQPYGWLLWIAVSERHRRHGIAAKLTDKLARRFKTAGAAFMLVNSATENTPAIKLFQNNGFAEQTTHLYLTRPL